MGRMGPPNVDYGRVGKSPAKLLTGVPHAHGTSGIHPVRAELKTPHGKEGLAQTRSNAGPIRVGAEIPSVTRKRAFLNQAASGGDQAVAPGRDFALRLWDLSGQAEIKRGPLPDQR